MRKIKFKCILHIGGDDVEEEKILDADATSNEDKLIHCTLRGCKRFWPPFRELVEGLSVVAKRMPSDYTDAFRNNNVGTVLSSILLIYFVVFGPSITFGILMFVFALLAGQPLSSIGPSGPNFIIETVITLFATKMSIDYQVFRFWVGVYITVFGVLLISLNLSSIAIYTRRSLEELLSGFISIFLILKALFSMLKNIPRNIPQPGSTEDLIKASQAAVHLFLALCMFIILNFINNLKRSHFFRQKIRYWLGAFNVPLGIVVVSLVAHYLFASYPVAKLDVPPTFQADPASWVCVINFAKINNYQPSSPLTVHISALFIGCFTSLLIFTETALNSITALKPKAKKPSPFVIDHVLTVVIFPLTCCIVGWPLMSGVPVRTIANTMALVQVESHPPPGKSAEIINLVEQRVSVLIAGLLVVVSVYLGDILRLIPVAALYGMFIYLGLNGLRGLDSVNTLLALMMRRKYWGDWEFLINLPIPQLAVIVIINFTELAILVVFIFLAEFAHAGYIVLLMPLVLIFSGLLREFILPKWTWLAPCLDKYDKRCLGVQSVDILKSPDVGPSIQINKDSSVETLVF
ncbi:unnamed protein product [Rodentolepis nana]|uniref:HCO3_cotransp domain-containing protein n=1 Tax=Rodentolepis nana TaxID=102285 RepID=A0A0R3T9Y5_RODNA|nr:unnamed protein product [Rodentolepis nana]